MKKLTAAQLAALKADGAVVEMTKKAPPKVVPPPKTDGLSKLLDLQQYIAAQNEQSQSRQALVLAEIVSRLGGGQEKLAEQITALVQQAATTGSAPYRFTIKRDSRGLIESVDALPIKDFNR